MRLKNNCVTLLQVKILQNIAKSDHYDSLVFFFLSIHWILTYFERTWQNMASSYNMTSVVT